MATHYFSVIIYIESSGFELEENSKQIRRYGELHTKLPSFVVPNTHVC